MIAITSSAASDTDSARKRCAGPPLRSTWRITSTPPPPGICTSSSTTSGSASITSRTASSTVAASPTTSTSPSSSARTPARNSWWSSTITTLGALIAPVTSSTSVPSPGRGVHARRGRRGAPCGRRSTRARRAGRRARASGSKPGPRSRTNTSIRSGADLGVERDRRRRRELGGVDHRLARGGHERLGARRRAARRRPRRPRPARRAPPRPRPRPPRARSRRVGSPGSRPPVQPRAQLALLAAGERGHLARVVGALLHQRERLQHRVVQVRGDLGALLRADPLGALGGQPAHEPQPPRREDQRERHHDHDDRRAARRAPAAARR